MKRKSNPIGKRTIKYNPIVCCLQETMLTRDDFVSVVLIVLI